MDGLGSPRGVSKGKYKVPVYYWNETGRHLSHWEWRDSTIKDGPSNFEEGQMRTYQQAFNLGVDVVVKGERGR